MFLFIRSRGDFIKSVPRRRRKGSCSAGQESLNLFPSHRHVYTLMSSCRSRTFCWTSLPPPPPLRSIRPTSSPPVMWVSSEQWSQPAPESEIRVRLQSVPLLPTVDAAGPVRGRERAAGLTSCHTHPASQGQSPGPPGRQSATVCHFKTLALLRRLGGLMGGGVQGCWRGRWRGIDHHLPKGFERFFVFF